MARWLNERNSLLPRCLKIFRFDAVPSQTPIVLLDETMYGPSMEAETNAWMHLESASEDPAVTASAI